MTPAEAPAPVGAEPLAERLAPYLADPALLRMALAHRSHCAENPGEKSNERLEFLGDAVLGLVVTAELYAAHPHLPEGDLARIRAAVVSTGALAPVAAGLGIGGELLLGKGEAASGGRDKPSILADALEALIGAVYLAHGLDRAREFVMGLLGAELASAAGAALGDAKNRLQELAVRIGEDAPRYRLREQGPDHDKRFSAEVYLGQRVLGRGTGRSKKQAERAAAEEAVAVLAEAEAPAGATAADGAPGGATPGDGPGAGERPSAASALS